jgi:LPS O-antigen subunit length determinant protein (WzzB/FepE family)
MKNLSIEWLIKEIYKRKIAFLLVFLFSLAGSLAIYQFLPKKYKSVGKINVSPKYFQNPMMMDFLPTVFDPTEMKSEREVAITGALSNEFLLNVLKSENPRFEHLSQVDKDFQILTLKKNFEIFRENNSVFVIAAIGKSPERSFELCIALINEILNKTKTDRNRYLEQLRDAVKARIQSLNGNQMGSSSVNEVRQQLTLLESQKKERMRTFSANHPDVVALNGKILSVKKLLENNVSENRVYNSQSIDPTQKTSDRIKDNLEEDLMKKYQNLEIVLDLDNKEKNNYVQIIDPPLRSVTAVSPKLTIFLAFGLLIGCFLGIGAVAFLSREELLEEMKQNKRTIDSLSKNSHDRRFPADKNKDYITMDQ